jgi:uncharacterized protein YqhQ
MPAATRYAPIGGQAVIEGVMMRSPSLVATAVRRQDGTIVVKRFPFVSISRRLRLLGLPIFRGAVALIESLRLGMGALTYSAEQAAAEEDTPEGGDANGSGDAAAEGGGRLRAIWDRLVTPLVIIASLALGLLIFFWVPLVLTDLTGAKSGFAFNLVDGAFRLIMFLAYLTAISMWSEMKRVFQYHGAEHKSIAAVEAGDELVPERVAAYSRFHPRCGTSFLLIVMLASIAVFMFLGRPETIADRLERLLFIPVIGGVAYELTRLSGKWAGHPLVRLLIMPGLLLQRITTREPTLDQLEVAIRSVREVTKESAGKLIPI